jgi:hypothetical protein
MMVFESAGGKMSDNVGFCRILYAARGIGGARPCGPDTVSNTQLGAENKVVAPVAVLASFPAGSIHGALDN